MEGFQLLTPDLLSTGHKEADAAPNYVVEGTLWPPSKHFTQSKPKWLVVGGKTARFTLNYSSLYDIASESSIRATHLWNAQLHSPEIFSSYNAFAERFWIAVPEYEAWRGTFEAELSNSRVRAGVWPSQSLARLYLASAAHSDVGEEFNRLPPQVEHSSEHDEAEEQPMLQDEILEGLRELIAERASGLFATLAYRISARGLPERFLTDQGLRFRSDVALLAMDVFTLDPYAAPAFLQHFSREVAHAAAAGALSGGWGKVMMDHGRIALQAVAAAESPASRDERARVVGGLKID